MLFQANDSAGLILYWLNKLLLSPLQEPMGYSIKGGLSSGTPLD